MRPTHGARGGLSPVPPVLGARGLPHVHQHEAGGVPEFVGEVARFGDAVLAEPDVLALGGEAQQGEAQGVRAVLVDHLHGVNAVAERLGHPAALFVQDGGEDVDLVKGLFVHELHAGHDHAGDPEVEDLAGGRQDVGRIEVGQFGSLLGPAEGGEGPEGTGKPSVQHVRVLGQLVGAGLLRGFVMFLAAT